ncbi:ABC transporter permease [Phaeacidiphilus oryzae]|uniref:ABC transporter permease n=1 Tax=Phaeacidiphilus oryzae TaxID=348818 RepID=UPI002AFF634C|nr:ABC transporter permease [Phaeacidiphilus oryzae]
MATGSAAALSGLGLVVCHRTTGVLNLAQGAIAMITAYALRQTAVVWHWPLALAAPVCVLLFAPALGWTLDALVFRPLQRAGADPTRTLVSTLGVFIALIGAATLLWGRAPLADTPALVPADSVGSLGGQPIRLDTVVQLAAVLALAGLTAGVGRWTRFGTEVRAVVDNRRLAELNGVDADRVASVGWAFGAFTAGLTGVLLAPLLRLDPYGLPLLVMETMAVAVAARLRGLGTAVLAGLALGVAQSELSRFHLPGSADQLLQSLTANLFVVALLAVVLLPSGASWSRSVEGPATSRRPERLGAGGRGALPALALSLLLLPLCLRGQSLHTALAFPALALILLSLTAVTGYGGQISLGQAGYAGLGALFTGWLTTGPGLPTLPALLLAVAITAPFGLLTGWPAIRRRGLALAVATFAVGTAMSRFVFQQPYATQNLDLTRHGWAAGDRAFYAAEAALLLLGLLAVHALHRGRPGRAIAAMRDHEAAAEAAGVDVPRLKLATFVAGAALAALGGGLLALGGQAFDPDAFDPVIGLVWFAAVVVLGADRPARAVLAAALLTALDGLAPSQSLSTALIGLLALLQGRFQARPGLPPALRLRLPHRPEPRPLRPTALARALLARRAAP